MTDETVGQAIKRLRTEARYRLREFATLVDVSAAYLSDIEHDRRVPTEDVLRRIAQRLQGRVPVTYDDLQRKSTRLEPELQEMIQTHPEVGQLLREVRQTGRPARDVIRELQDHLRSTTHDEETQ